MLFKVEGLIASGLGLLSRGPAYTLGFTLFRLWVLRPFVRGSVGNDSSRLATSSLPMLMSLPCVITSMVMHAQATLQLVPNYIQLP